MCDIYGIQTQTPHRAHIQIEAIKSLPTIDIKLLPTIDIKYGRKNIGAFLYHKKNLDHLELHV